MLQKSSPKKIGPTRLLIIFYLDQAERKLGDSGILDILLYFLSKLDLKAKVFSAQLYFHNCIILVWTCQLNLEKEVD